MVTMRGWLAAITVVGLGVGAAAPCAAGDELDFDLLGEAPAPAPAVDEAAVAARRLLLEVHQGLGLGLLAATTGLCVVGQLNYQDLHHGGQTGRYEPAHAYLAYGTLGLFAVTGLAALVAPVPFAREGQGVDRTLWHKIALGASGAAMLAAGGLGLYSASRVGRLDQRRYTEIHLGVSYAALAAMLGGVAVLIF